MKSIITSLGLAILLGLSGCGGDDGSSADGGEGEGEGEGEGAAEGEGEGEPATEFAIRVPSERSVDAGPMGEQTVPDLDLICRVRHEDVDGEVYVQSSPVRVVNMTVEYEQIGAWCKEAGVVRECDAVLDTGHHATQRINVSLGGRSFQLDQSSIGFGGRPCAPPDCLRVCEDAACDTVVLDGCAREECEDVPSIRIACVEVQQDGSVPALLDPWSPSDEDDRYPLLGCGGDQLCRQD